MDKEHPKLQRRNRTTFIPVGATGQAPVNAPIIETLEESTEFNPTLPAVLKVHNTADSQSRSNSPLGKKPRASDTPPSPRSKPEQPANKPALQQQPDVASVAQKLNIDFADMEFKVPPVPPKITSVDGIEDLPEIPYHYVRASTFFFLSVTGFFFECFF